MKTIKELYSLYQKGTNISKYLREENQYPFNAKEIIEISYELQTGSYIEAINEKRMAEHKREYSREIAKTILSLCDPKSILEAGVGEATTLSGVISSIKMPIDFYGFDLSWSRVATGKRWLKSNGIYNTNFCTGDLFDIPFADNSIDVVYTSHSIEPNGGNEQPIIKELYRVAKKFLILLEPGYELATDEAKRRMVYHGYCKNILTCVSEKKYDVLKHELFKFTSNPLNPTAITIIRKEPYNNFTKHILACPKYKTPLEEIGEMMYSPEAMVVYPILYGIPCLRIGNGIFASKYKEIISSS